MLRIYFVRHGQTDWNSLKKLQGQQDASLNELGVRQSQAAAKRLKNVPLEAIYASDLTRARQTAQAINTYHNLPLLQRPHLRERCFGIFEGHTIEQCTKRHPDVRAAYERDRLGYKIPEGESYLEFTCRVGAFFEVLRKEHGEQTIAVVAHGGVLGAAFSHIVSQQMNLASPPFLPLFAVGNCSISQLQHKEGRWLVHSLNQTDHLSGLVGDDRPAEEYA
ncbi:MAG TPA: histidine phosphatase family protein [Candidatus Bipolaricaulota bacterium]